MQFLPTTPEELKKLKIKKLDVILVTGDSYIDSPFIGTAVIGRWLQKNGYSVGIIAQPDISCDADIARLGEPNLFWGVSGGSVDSMVANYTPLKKFRKNDDYTPGGINNKRPDRAVLAYSNLIRRFFKNTAPIVLGGLEASLRRITHYDFWDDSLRRPILFDAKADLLIYGMGELASLEICENLKRGTDCKNIRGCCYISKEAPENYIQLPSFEDSRLDKLKFIDMFNAFYQNNDPQSARGLYQKAGERYLVHNPPARRLTSDELDSINGLPFTRSVHPYYETQGKITAQDTIKFSITSHRGCFGECNFCSIAVHQGRAIISRSAKSIIAEAEKLTQLDGFKGYISDVGGPTANMYCVQCDKMIRHGACRNKKCLYPQKCESLEIDHAKQIDMLKKLKKINGIKKIFIASGIRHDMILCDKKNGMEYLKLLSRDHVSGQLKIAPEHSEEKVLRAMGKPSASLILKFKTAFEKFSREAGLRQFLTYYLIAAHPGCAESEMIKMKKFVSEELKISPEQVQIFTPTPSTYSTLMYYTEMDPFTKEKIFVEKNPVKKERQKKIITG